MNGSRSVITENGAIFICGGEIKNASKIDATENQNMNNENEENNRNIASKNLV